MVILNKIKRCKILILRSHFPVNIFTILIFCSHFHIFHSEDVLWKVRTNYQNFNKILHLLILFKMAIKLWLTYSSSHVFFLFIFILFYQFRIVKFFRFFLRCLEKRLALCIFFIFVQFVPGSFFTYVSYKLCFPLDYFGRTFAIKVLFKVFWLNCQFLLRKSFIVESYKYFQKSLI